MQCVFAAFSGVQRSPQKVYAFPRTHLAPKYGGGETLGYLYYFPFGKAYFQGPQAMLVLVASIGSFLNCYVAPILISKQAR